MNAAEYVELRDGRGAAVRRIQGGWMVTCPAHEDRTPSLHVSEGGDGRALLHCQAGCPTDAVLAADALDFRDLFDGHRRNGRVEVAAYRYLDEHSVHLYDVVRFEPKDFRQRRPDGAWGIGGVRRVLYHLPQALAAIQAGKTVYVAEGEKDVHALERAGEVATCNPMGAGKWRAEYAESLRGTNVVVVADRDEPGRKHARAVAHSLERVAAAVRLVQPLEREDIAAHLAASGKLSELVPLDRDDNGAAADNDGLASLLDGNPLDPTAVPDDPLHPLPGLPFITPSATAIISGPTGRGRSQLAEVMLYDAAKAGVRGAYLGWEITKDEFDARGAAIARARDDELTPELLQQLANVRYLELADNIAAAWTSPDDWLAGIADRYSVVVIDPLSSVASTLALDFDNNTQYLQFHDRIVEPLKLRGCSPVLIDNVGHSENAQERPSGGAAKMWRQDLQYSCKATSHPVPGLVIQCKKVRGVRVPWSVGDKWLFERDSQRITRDAPAAATPAEAGTKRRTWYMEQISRVLEDAPHDGDSRTSLRKSVGHRASYVDEATQTLKEEGYLEEVPDGRPRFRLRRPYRQRDDAACPDPVPTP